MTKIRNQLIELNRLEQNKPRSRTDKLLADIDALALIRTVFVVLTFLVQITIAIHLLGV